MATIQGIYIALFGRPADPLGLEYFNNATNNGADLTAIGDLAATAEYQDRFDGMNNSQIVTAIYQSLFGRNPELAGLEFFVNALNNGTLNINNVAIAILDGAQGDDAALVEAKIAAAEQFTAAVAADADALAAYQGTQGADFGRAFINQIDDAADELTDEQVAQQIADYVETGAGPGEDPNAPTNPINFTSAVGEQLVGTAANDSFSGVIGADAANSTINIGDTVNGAGGVDTLNILVAGGAALPAGFTSSNVEIVNVNYAAATNLGALNSASFGGVQQLWQIDTNAAAGTFQDVTVGAGVTAGFRSTNVTASAQVATSTVTAAAGVTAVSVALDGVADTSAITIAETTATNVSTLNVSGTVAANAPTVAGTVTLDTAAGTTDVDTLNLAITSNAIVAMGANLDNLNTIDASASTGNLQIAIGAQTELASVTLGSGGDTVGISTAALNATTPTLTIDMGAGNDVLTLTAVANANANAVSVTLGAGNDTLTMAALSNISATTAIDADLVTVTDFNAAQDVLVLTALGDRDVLVNTELANISGAATLAAAAELAAQATTLNDYSVFNYGGDAYVLANYGAQGFDAGDGLMKVVGFSVEAITGTNFVA